MEKEFKYSDFSLTYHTYGKGAKTLLCFHGFGRSYRDFEFLADPFPDYTIVAVNLPLHHGSAYPDHRIEKNPMLPSEWNNLIKAFLSSLQIDRFSLMGYSMGGKMALMLVTTFASRMDQLILVAPDGIRMNPWYKLSSGSAAGRSLSRTFMRNPKPLLRFADFMTKTRLLPRHLKRLATIHLSDEKHRQLVYRVWMAMRLMRPNLKEIKAALADAGVKVTLVFGIHDRVIPAEIANDFQDENFPYQVLKLETGHVLLTPLLVAAFQKENVL